MTVRKPHNIGESCLPCVDFTPSSVAERIDSGNGHRGCVSQPLISLEKLQLSGFAVDLNKYKCFVLRLDLIFEMKMLVKTEMKTSVNFKREAMVKMFP